MSIQTVSTNHCDEACEAIILTANPGHLGVESYFGSTYSGLESAWSCFQNHADIADKVLKINILLELFFILSRYSVQY